MSGTRAIHATCLAVGAAGILLRGRPGSGKSSLALSLMARDSQALAVRLVADDSVCLTAAHGRVVASGPPAIAGLLEVRGAGLVSCPCLPRAVLRLVVDLGPPGGEDRLPEAEAARIELCGVWLPRLAATADAAAPERVLAALGHLASGGRLPALPRPFPHSGLKDGGGPGQDARLRRQGPSMLNPR